MWSWGKAEVDIARRPEAVWEWLVDPERMGRQIRRQHRDGFARLKQLVEAEP